MILQSSNEDFVKTNLTWSLLIFPDTSCHFSGRWTSGGDVEKVDKLSMSLDDLIEPGSQRCHSMSYISFSQLWQLSL